MRGKGHQRAESNRGKESVWGWRGNEAREQQQSLEANIKGDYLRALRSHMLTLAVVWTPDLLNSKHAKETCLVILATLATSRPRKNVNSLSPSVHMRHQEKQFLKNSMLVTQIWSPWKQSLWLRFFIKTCQLLLGLS